MRDALIERLGELGPATGEEPLRALFPQLARREIRDLLHRYRALYVRRNGIIVRELQWLVPGAVWALDFTLPPSPVDGASAAILAVRDLGSAKALLWRGSKAMTQADAVVNVRTLFSVYGAPLVLKSDRGSAFISESFEALLREHGVIHLLSPARSPQYNGSIESALGWLKVRTEWQAASRGRPAEWSSDDLDQARRQTNALARRAGAEAPDVRWERRSVPAAADRRAFEATLEAQRLEVRAESASSEKPLADDEIERQAICRALVAHGFLLVRRRSVSLPKKLLRRARVS